MAGLSVRLAADDEGAKNNGADIEVIIGEAGDDYEAARPWESTT